MTLTSCSKVMQPCGKSLPAARDWCQQPCRARCAQVDELQQSHQSEAKRRAVLECSLRETQAAHKRALYNMQTEVGSIGGSGRSGQHVHALTRPPGRKEATLLRVRPSQTTVCPPLCARPRRTLLNHASPCKCFRTTTTPGCTHAVWRSRCHSLA